MKQIFNKTYLEELSDDQYESLFKFIHEDISSSMEMNELCEKMREIRKTRIKRSGVFIETKCGETHHVEPSQEVTTIYVEGKRVYSRGSL